jgi:quinol monooxygenase YgiN
MIIIRAISTYADREERDRVAALIHEALPAINAEPGVVEYWMTLDYSDQRKLMTTELYYSEQGLIDRCRQPHTQALFAALFPLQPQVDWAAWTGEVEDYDIGPVTAMVAGVDI